MEVVGVVFVASVALWLSGGNWEQRTVSPSIFGDIQPVRPPRRRPGEVGSSG